MVIASGAGGSITIRRSLCVCRRLSTALPAKRPEPGASHQERVRRREAGHDVIFLTVGDPDQAAHPLLADHRLSAGRAAVAARFERRTGRPCSADNIVLTYSTTTPSPIFRVFAADPHTGVVHFHDHVDALGDGE